MTTTGNRRQHRRCRAVACRPDQPHLGNRGRDAAGRHRACELQGHQRRLAPERRLGPEGTQYDGDPIADVAVLCSPDDQTFADEADAYDELVSEITPFLIAEAPEEEMEHISLGDEEETTLLVPKPSTGSARVLSLAREWVECTVERVGPTLAIEPQVILALTPECQVRRSFRWRATQSASYLIPTQPPWLWALDEND